MGVHETHKNTRFLLRFFFLEKKFGETLFGGGGREGWRKGERVCVCMCEYVCVCVGVCGVDGRYGEIHVCVETGGMCVCQRERERERVCVYACVYVCGTWEGIHVSQ